MTKALTIPRYVGGLVSLCLAFGATAGCSHDWAPGPTVTQADFVPTRAKCSIMARHGGNGFSAYGSARFVAAAAIGNAIGNAFQANADFNDCMQASGFLIADKQAPRSVAYAAPVAPAAGPYSSTAPMPQQVPLVPHNATAYYPEPPSTPEIAELQECIANLRANEYFQPILSHLPDPSGNYSLTQLADNGRPTPEERTAFASFHDTTAVCIRHFAAVVRLEAPGAAEVVSNALDDRKAALVPLISGRETWGTYAQQDQRIRQDLKVHLHGPAPT